MTIQSYLEECHFLEVAAEALATEVDPKNISNVQLATLLDLEKRVCLLAGKEIENALDRSRLLRELSKVREHLSFNHSRQPNYSAYFNAHAFTAPALFNHGYNAPQIGTVSNYNILSSPILIANLGEGALEDAPPQIRELVRRKNKEAYLFMTVNDSRAISQPAKKSSTLTLNVCFHQWIYNGLQFGDNKAYNFSMGIFPVFGVSPGKNLEKAIGFNELKSLRVHAHLGREGDIMVYSPNNAQFEIETDTPVQIFWAVAETGTRILAQKVFLVPTQDDPIAEAFFASSRRCKNLKEYHEQLERRINAIFKNTFLPLIKDLRQGQLKGFERLPNWIKKGVFKEACVLQKQDPVPADFGKEIFTQGSTNEQKAQAADAFSRKLIGMLISSQKTLLESLPVVKKQDPLKLFTIAEQLLKNPDSNQVLGSLTAKEREKIYQTMWYLSSGQICSAAIQAAGKDKTFEEYGSHIFHSPTTPVAEKIKAVLGSLS